MNHILFFHIDPWNLNTIPESDGTFVAYHFYDQGIYSCPPAGENKLSVDYYNVEHLKNCLANISPISQVFIITRMIDGPDRVKITKTILDKVLLILQSITIPLMSQRQGKVWLLYRLEEDPKDPAPGLGAGLRTLIQVYAMEMSKKNIAANFISASLDQDNLMDIILWGEAKTPFNLTSQHLVLPEVAWKRK